MTEQTTGVLAVLGAVVLGLSFHNKLGKHVGEEDGQDIVEYAVMLAVIIVIAVGTVRLIGTNASTVFSQIGSALQ